MNEASDETSPGDTQRTFELTQRDMLRLADKFGSNVLPIAIAAGTLGPFVTAFCTELGRRFGGTVADWASRVYLRRKHGDDRQAELFVEVDDTVIVIDLEQGLGFESSAALLELDIDAEDVRGHRLKWNDEARAWMSTGRFSPGPR
jgi:hypothetical protein